MGCTHPAEARRTRRRRNLDVDLGTIRQGADVLSRQRTFVEIEAELRPTAYRRTKEPVQLQLVRAGRERKLDVGGGLRPTNRFRPRPGGHVEPDAMTFSECARPPSTCVAGCVAERSVGLCASLEVAGSASQESGALQ